MAVTIAGIRTAMQTGRWAMSGHARRNAGQRSIRDEELMQALASGEILEDYSTDPRGPSALALGHTAAGRSVHAVCALDPSGALVVITVYEPAMPWWRDERTRNR